MRSMGDRSDRTHDTHRGSTSLGDRSCPLCGDALVDTQYPRRRITLEDEADGVQNRTVCCRLCQACWQTFYRALTNETTA